MPPLTQIKPQASLDHIMEVYYTFVRLADPEFDEKAMKAMLLVNLRRDNDNNEAIFDEIAMAFPVFGCPMAVYNEVYMQCNNGVAEAKKSAKKKKKAAAMMLTNANAEYTDHYTYTTAYMIHDILQMSLPFYCRQAGSVIKEC
jgi:hypothetical protein